VAEATCQLIEPLVMGFYMAYPRRYSVKQDVRFDGGEQPDFPPNRYRQALYVDDPRESLSDVTLTIRVKAEFYDINVTRKLNVLIMEAVRFTCFAHAGYGCDGLTHVETIARDDWNRWVHEEGDHHATIGVAGNHKTCVWTTSYQVIAEYQVRGEDVEETTPPHARVVSRHRTRIGGPGEQQGIYHWKLGKLVINRRTGRACGVIQSFDGRYTIFGAKAAPHDGEGNRVAGHCSPGTMECLTTGELGGVVARFDARVKGPGD
jgi:hypothetical protein